jgi:NAD(P)-dependent dehydrogenase (short-subunit alcohol dehydrogenase family)
MSSVIAVIGAGPGIGTAVARRFCSSGFSAAVLSRGKSAVAAAETLTQDGFSAKAFEVDAGSAASIGDALVRVHKDLGPVDVLVYNAAAVTQALPTELGIDQLLHDFKIGVAGALAAAQTVAPHMIEKGSGTILFTGGGFAHRPIAVLTSLGIEKAAIRNLAFSLAEELTPKGIRVGTVTVLGLVKPGTAFDPGRIAEKYWAVHQDRSGALGVDVPFSGTHPA